MSNARPRTRGWAATIGATCGSADLGRPELARRLPELRTKRSIINT
jgi:hypothetical protein